MRLLYNFSLKSITQEPQHNQIGTLQKIIQFKEIKLILYRPQAQNLLLINTLQHKEYVLEE